MLKLGADAQEWNDLARTRSIEPGAEIVRDPPGTEDRAAAIGAVSRLDIGLAMPSPVGICPGNEDEMP